MSAHVLLIFIKGVEEKRLNVRLVEHFIAFSQHFNNIEV